jgi:hypothetical protein
MRGHGVAKFKHELAALIPPGPWLDVGAGLGKRHVTQFVDDKQFDGDELRLEFEQTPLVARFHQLMNEPGRREEGNGKAMLAGGQAERQTDDQPIDGHALSVAMARFGKAFDLKCKDDAQDLEVEHGKAAVSWFGDRPTAHDLRRTLATRLAARTGISRSMQRRIAVGSPPFAAAITALTAPLCSYSL